MRWLIRFFVAYICDKGFFSCNQTQKLIAFSPANTQHRNSIEITLHICLLSGSVVYGKCPEISYIKVCDQMAFANSVGPDQTALAV